MPRQCQMHARVRHGIYSIPVPPYSFAQFAAFANRHRKQRMVRDQNASFGRWHHGKAFPQHRDLIAIDSAVLYGQRSSGIDAQNRDLVIFKPRAQVIVDIAFVTIKRRCKAFYYVI